MANDGELGFDAKTFAFDAHPEISNALEDQSNVPQRHEDQVWDEQLQEEAAENWQPRPMMERMPEPFAGITDEEETATPPIDMPTQRRDIPEDGRNGQDLPYGPQYFESMEDFVQKRRPTIKFSPEVTFENGHRQSLDQPLKKLQIKTRPRGRSFLQEIGAQGVGSPLQESHSEADHINLDFDGGEESMSLPSLERDTEERNQEQSRCSLLQSNLENLRITCPVTDLENSTSLTSETTASPTAEEILTPSDIHMPPFASPLTIVSPWAHPTSLEESSAWPNPHQLVSTSRAKSYNVKRLPSLRASRRQPFRRMTSDSLSPASAFLSRWGREESLPDPDSEGQEVGDYVLGKEIGFGGFSVVREAFTLSHSSRVRLAVKIVRKQVSGKGEHENEKLQSEFEHEVALWRCLSHAHILPLIAVYISPIATFAFTHLTTGGSLFSLIRCNRNGLPGSLARRYAFHLASALRYLHEDVRIVHRDIKLENCLLDISAPDAESTGGTLLLCDFGLADYLTNERASDSDSDDSGHAIGPSETSTSIAGSLPYAAPEVVRGGKVLLKPAVDIWAYGIVIFALIVGDLPFQHALAGKVAAMILEGSWDVIALRTRIAAWEPHRPPEAADAAAEEVLTGCLIMESEARWTIGMCLDSKWLSACDDGDESDEARKNGWAANS